MAATPITQSTARRAGMELLLAFVLLTSVPFVVYLDTQVLGTSMSESSLTEVMQSALLAISAAIFGIAALKDPDIRGYVILVATLFTCMLIRESDVLFDRIAQGFWLYPALLVFAIGIILSRLSAGNVKASLSVHFQHRSGTLMYLGLFLVVVFSRLFGTGALWEGVMGDNYDPAVKAAIQEGLELMGYVVIACGSINSATSRFGQRS